MQFLQEIIEEKQYEDGRKPTPPEKRSISIDNEEASKHTEVHIRLYYLSGTGNEDMYGLSRLYYGSC